MWQKRWLNSENIINCEYWVDVEVIVLIVMLSKLNDSFEMPININVKKTDEANQLKDITNTRSR